MTGLNILDFVIVLIFVGSILAGFVRGVVKEVVALLTWVAAFFIASMFAKQLAATLMSSSAMQSIVSSISGSMSVDPTSSVSLVALGISFLLLFIGTMLAGSIVNYLLTTAVASVGIGFINRLLGGAFGMARGYILALVMLFLISLTPLTAQAWWQGSQFVPQFTPAIEWLGNLVQPGIESLKSTVGDSFQNINSRVHDGVSNFYPRSQ